MRARISVPASAGLLLLVTSAVLAAPPRFASSFFSYDAGFDGRAVAVGDVDGDSRADALVLNSFGLEVRLGAGDGTLGSAIVTPLTATLLATGDLDGDGALDVVTDADSLHVAVRLGNGDGTFAAPTSWTVLKRPAALLLADLDEDGDLDLVCSASQSSAISVLPGNGSGGFGARTDVAVASSPRALAVGDLDHDGNLDIAVAHTAPWSLTRLLGNGAGAFTVAGATPLSDLPWDLSLADVDGDSWLDAVIGVITVSAFITVPGGPGGFGVPASHSLADIPRVLIVTNVDGDGDADIVAIRANENRGDVLRGATGSAFAAAQGFTTPRFPFGIAAGDLNGGGKADLVCITHLGPIGVLMGNGDGTFGGLGDVTDAGGTWSVACADLDADGRDDIATARSSDATVSVRFGEVGGTWTAPVTLATMIEPHDVKIADMDADGHLDLVVAEHGPGTQTQASIAVFRGNGARGFAARQGTTTGRWPEAVAVGDLNGDALPDLAVALNDFAASLTVLLGAGGGTFGTPQNYALGSNAADVAIADVTRDGLPDVLLAAYGANQAIVVPRLAGGGFGTPITLAVQAPNAIGVANAAGDAEPDLIVTGSLGLSVIPSTPGGGFGPRADFGGPAGPFKLAIADLDGDGRQDVATANNWPTNAVSVWLGDAVNGLDPVTSYGAGDQPFDVAVGDVNDDGLPDLVTANLQSSSVSLLVNTGGIAWIPWLGTPPPVAPASLTLRARPNPVLASALVEYSLPRAQRVSLRLLDVAGRELASLEDGDRPAGPHVVSLRTHGLRPGVAFLDLRAGAERVVRRVVLLH